METAEQTTMRTRDQIEEMLFDVNAVNHQKTVDGEDQETSRMFRLGVIHTLLWVLEQTPPSFLETWIQRHQ